MEHDSHDPDMDPVMTWRPGRVEADLTERKT